MIGEERSPKAFARTPSPRRSDLCYWHFPCAEVIWGIPPEVQMGITRPFNALWGIFCLSNPPRPPLRLQQQTRSHEGQMCSPDARRWAPPGGLGRILETNGVYKYLAAGGEGSPSWASRHERPPLPCKDAPTGRLGVTALQTTLRAFFCDFHSCKIHSPNVNVGTLNCAWRSSETFGKRDAGGALVLTGRQHHHKTKVLQDSFSKRHISMFTLLCPTFYFEYFVCTHVTL